MTIRLLIVDDHSLVREGLRMAFEGTDIEIVAEAVDGQDAFEKLQQLPVDVALVDIRMPGADGIQFLQRLREAGLSLPVVLMHTVDEGVKSLRRCQEMGAKGLVPKGHDRQELLDAVHQVYAGQEFWDFPTSHAASGAQ
jgi:two-component system nitrate/nitrite response regulator NarL